MSTLQVAEKMTACTSPVLPRGKKLLDRNSQPRNTPTRVVENLGVANLPTRPTATAKMLYISFFRREMSPARWGHPGGCPPAGPASNVVSGKVEKIRENKEHLVPGPFT